MVSGTEKQKEPPHQALKGDPQKWKISKTIN
jgi:hypothetical protein